MSGLEGLLTGQTLVKRYRIREVIGRGGFAAVYRADDERLGRPVAVKVITMPAPDAEAATRHRERFEREARAAASLPQHPNVVTVHDFGIDPVLGLDFLVMEFLHGEDLATRLRREGRPSVEAALEILRDAAAGIAVGHRAGIVHRDVKPGNIFLARGEGSDGVRVCILDFGIARVVADDHTLTGAEGEGLPLSPAYASPEQTRGARDLTPASDVFSLGVVAYQLLTGEKPFPQARGLRPEEWVPRRPLRELNPAVPVWLATVISRSLAFLPEDRFADAEDFAAALAAQEESDATLMVPPPGYHEPSSASAPEPDRTLYQPAPEPPRSRQRLAFTEPPPRRRRSWTGPLLFLFLLGVGGAGAWWYLRDGAPPAAVDPSAREDLEVVEEALDDGPAERDGESAFPADEVISSPQPQPNTAPVAGIPFPTTDSAVFDSLAPVAGDTLLLQTDFAAPTVDSADLSPADTVQLPPPRVIGVPVDSVADPAGPPPTPGSQDPPVPPAAAI